MITHITGAEGKDAQALVRELAGSVPKIREALIRKNTERTIGIIRASATPDQHVIHAINTIEEIDKAAGVLTKRVRDWYAMYWPEKEHTLKDHRAFIEDVLKGKAKPKDSFGAEFSKEDLDIVLTQARTIHALYQQRDALITYLEAVMQAHMPNVKKVAGPTIGARLIAIAGSLERLSRMPAGTVQLLGAETALFRHLRNKSSKPPKHGVIFNHPIVQKAGKARGKAARVLADVISIAAKIDHFKGEYMGDALLEKAEARFR